MPKAPTGISHSKSVYFNCTSLLFLETLLIRFEMRNILIKPKPRYKKYRLYPAISQGIAKPPAFRRWRPV
jgi:hypothetical protein